MAELRGAGFSVNGTTILDDVTTQFRDGRFNVILGPNGAGKSTLLKLATGLLEPTAGDVLYEGRPVASYATNALAKKRAVLSQRVVLAFPMPVHEVVMMGRYPHYGRAPATRDRRIVDEALDLVGMSARRDQHYATLSGGEQQKIQLARVLAQIWPYEEPGERKFLFLDEPITGLDVHYQLHMLDIARDLVAHGCTIVAILHDLNIALQYGNSFFAVQDGRLVREADSAEDISRDLIESLFGVRAHRLTDPENNQSVWRFDLAASV